MQSATSVTINGNSAKKIKLEGMGDPHASNGDVSPDQWLYHELGEVWLIKEDKSVSLYIDGKRQFLHKCA